MQDQDRPGSNPPVEPTSPMAFASPEGLTATRRRSRVGTGLAVAAIAIGALGVAGTAYAASSTPSPSPTTGTEGPRVGTPGQIGQPGDHDGDGSAGAPPGRGMGRHGGPGGIGMGMRGGIHGSFVTPRLGGGYQTIEAQRGTVTGVSSTSITVKSEDGFTATYVVTADTIVNATRDGIASVKTGDEVGVTAIKGASDSTAVMIMDRTGIYASRQKWAPAKPATPGGATGATGASGATGTGGTA